MGRIETVITGIGMVSALGLGRRENWENLCAGRSGVGPVLGFDTSTLPVRIASQVPGAFEDYMAAHFPRSVMKRTARFSQLCLAAARMAIEDGGLDLEREDRTRIGVVVGNQGYGIKLIDEEIARAAARGGGTSPSQWWQLDLDPMAVLKIMGNCCVAQVSIQFGLTGPTMTVGMACASGAAAMCIADDLLQLGRADVVVVGGTEALVSPFPLLGFGKLTALSARNTEPERASRPFDRERDGFVLGEGAGMMLLETAAHARRRRADVYARLLGHAMTSEAFNLTAPAHDGAGMARTMSEAMRHAGVAPDEVYYVSAHGTSTQLNDFCETHGIRRAFGEHARRLWVSSQKSMLGHTISASGAIETAVTALTLKEGVVTPTINYEHPDPGCDLDYVPNAARERRGRVALSNSFGFGGHNVSLVLGAPAGH
jgi:3-oxoacyl-[acyl-carrier-protein] synthase II